MKYQEIYIGRAGVEKKSHWVRWEIAVGFFRNSLGIDTITTSAVVNELGRVLFLKMFGLEIHTRTDIPLYLKDIDLQGEKFHYPAYSTFNITDLTTGKTHFDKTSIWTSDPDKTLDDELFINAQGGSLKKPTAKVEIKTNHYENKHGVDLMDYLQSEVFTADEMKIIAKFNMIKYMARAGKKKGESIKKDVNKAQSYQTIYAENDSAYQGWYISGDVASIVEDFKGYKNEE